MRNELTDRAARRGAGRAARPGGHAAGLGVDADDLVLDRLGLAGEQLLEVGVAHDLGVFLERVGDLLLLVRAGAPSLLSAIA